MFQSIILLLERASGKFSVNSCVCLLLPIACSGNYGSCALCMQTIKKHTTVFCFVLANQEFSTSSFLSVKS